MAQVDRKPDHVPVCPILFWSRGKEERERSGEEGIRRGGWVVKVRWRRERRRRRRRRDEGSTDCRYLDAETQHAPVTGEDLAGKEDRSGGGGGGGGQQSQS